MKSKDEKWALFWCNLLHPVIFGEIEKEQTNLFLKKLCLQEVVFPNGKRKRPTISTLRRKLNRYRKDGFQSLARKARSDRGASRRFSPEIIDKAVELKKEQPRRSDDCLNRFLEKYYGKTIPKSTLYRHLRLAGRPGSNSASHSKRCVYALSREHTHDLWIGDFQEGPFVLVDGEALPTNLCLFIDCYSRYVVEGRYYLKQTLDILIDSLIRAWTIHGSPKELYLDNAKVYHSDALRSACYNLGIKLIHRPPRDPAPGGLVERFFGTSQTQFESEVRSGDIITLDAINQAFSAYLAVVYHARIHSETNQSPKQRYDEGLTVIRHVDMDAALAFFMKRIPRTVDRTFADVRIDNRFYRVDPKLRGDKVEVRYDPYGDLKKVLIYSANGEYLGSGNLYLRDQGAETPAASPSKPKHNYLDLITQKHKSILQAQAKGIDYHQIISERPWPFMAFVQKLALLMGHKGSLSAFSSHELESLKKCYNRIPALNESLLTEAFQNASVKTLPYIIRELQIAYSKKEVS
ncbi:Mu transposase C-terminal domain-containing protein [Candidatus Kuenenia stuttgartensis]|nr:Mu transposase C-terminal domain-containing protein [Candidatus Kuenenia stuttgartiensis]